MAFGIKKPKIRGMIKINNIIKQKKIYLVIKYIKFQKKLPLFSYILVHFYSCH